MATATVFFQELLQDSHELGSDDAHMIARIRFDLMLGNKTFPGLFAHIKQPVGSNFETTPLEVTSPQGYTGLMNYTEFRAAAEGYYRHVIGRGINIRLRAGSTIRMRNNRFQVPGIAQFEVDCAGGPW